jgi:hypothetical protein
MVALLEALQVQSQLMVQSPSQLVVLAPVQSDKSSKN